MSLENKSDLSGLEEGTTAIGRRRSIATKGTAALILLSGVTSISACGNSNPTSSALEGCNAGATFSSDHPESAQGPLCWADRFSSIDIAGFPVDPGQKIGELNIDLRTSSDIRIIGVDLIGDTDGAPKPELIGAYIGYLPNKNLVQFSPIQMKDIPDMVKAGELVPIQEGVKKDKPELQALGDGTRPPKLVLVMTSGGAKRAYSMAVEVTYQEVGEEKPSDVYAALYNQRYILCESPVDDPVSPSCWNQGPGTSVSTSPGLQTPTK